MQVWLHTYAKNGIRTAIAKFVLATFTEQFYIDMLNKPEYEVLVCVRGQHLLGFIAVNLQAHHVDESNGYEIDTFYISEHFQGQGIGRLLLEGIKASFGEPFWLHTWVHNEAAIGFYKHLGFEDIGEVPFEFEGESHENRVLVYKADV